MFPIIQSIHLAGIALLVGTIVITDLRVLGYALTRYDVSDVAQQFAPWTRIGLTIMLTTGPVLFASDFTRYIHNPAFILKMVILTITLVLHFSIERRSKLTAALSIVLWTCVVLTGRAIADFDI